MLRADEGALECDLAETYGVFDRRAIPAKLLGTLAAGLRDESRSKMNLHGQKAPRMEVLLAAIVDGINRVTWLLSAVCPQEGTGPKSVLESILSQQESEGEQEGYNTPEDFWKAWQMITGAEHGTE